MFQTFQTLIPEANLAMPPPPSPPVAAMPPPKPPKELPEPPPTPPLAPSDIHDKCVPVQIFQGLESDYQALENRLKSVMAENRVLRKSVEYYKTLSNAQREGDLPKKTSDLIFKKRLQPFMTETKANMWVKNLKRPRQWEAEDLNVGAEIASHVSKKGYDIVRGHLHGPSRRTLQKRFSWLSITPGIIKPISKLSNHNIFVN